MAFCDKWMIVGLVIGYAPLVITVLATTFVARMPKNFWVGAGLSGVVFSVLGLTLHSASLILWNGLRPALCNGMN